MDSRFAQPLPEELEPSQRELYDAITGGPRAGGIQSFPLTDGERRLNGPFGLMLMNPSLGGLLQRLGSGLRFEGTLTAREREVAILAVGSQTQSTFEVWAHRRVGETVGLTADEIDAVLIGRFRSDDAREQVCHDFTRLVLSGGDVGDIEFEKARDLIGDAGVFELTTIAGYYFTLAALLRVFRIGPPPTP